MSALSSWALTCGVAVLAFAVALPSCTSLRDGVADPIGRRFPTVVAESLDGQKVRLPEDFAGKPLVAIVATEQEAQFDIDRWLIGLLELETPAAIREVPTVAGFVPGLLRGTIDGGMRRGIPEEDWGSVITLYGDNAARVVDFFGNRNPRNGRIVLVSPDGTISWVHDRGFSARVLRDLDQRVRAMQP